MAFCLACDCFKRCHDAPVTLYLFQSIIFIWKNIPEAYTGHKILKGLSMKLIGLSTIHGV